jgi:hypothetical protein
MLSSHLQQNLDEDDDIKVKKTYGESASHSVSTGGSFPKGLSDCSGEADHSFHSQADVYNVQNFTSMPPVHLHDMVLVTPWLKNLHLAPKTMKRMPLKLFYPL